MLFNIHRDRKTTKPAVWLDVFPQHRRDEPDSDELAFRRFHAWALMHNALHRIKQGEAQ